MASGSTAGGQAAACPCLNSTNVTVGEGVRDFCATDLPTAGELFEHMPGYGYALFAILILFVILTILIYLEEVHFIRKHFPKGGRRTRTIWILAFFPVFATTGLLGVLVPRSGTFVDMVSNAFFGTCLYSFGWLMVSYMGGPQHMWEIIENDRKVQLNTPPCCCCCLCLPNVTFNRKCYSKITILVMQVALVRPLLMFIAAVLWTNGSYMPGDVRGNSSFLYITVLNVVSTCTAMYGLMLLRGVLRAELEHLFSITGKIASLQLTLIFSALPNLIIGALVTTNVITCSPLFPSKGRGDAIYHAFLVLIMLPFSLLGRAFYRRPGDGAALASASKHLTSINEKPASSDGKKELDNGGDQREMMILKKLDNEIGEEEV